MKRTILDRAIGLVSPQAELRRVRARLRTDAELRAYDIAKSFSTSDWTPVGVGSSANQETKTALTPGRLKARHLMQNTPYGARAVNVIVANVVGAGIVPKITGKNKRTTKELNKLWKEVAETAKCDSENRHNFYGLQALACRSMVGDGEGLGLLEISPDAPKVKMLESEYIATERDTLPVVQGIELDSSGRRTKYHIYKQHPSDSVKTEIIQVPAEQVLHPYRQDRPGQVRGVTWAHAVVEKMNDLGEYQHATLIRQKIAACFAAFIKTPGTDFALSAEALKAKRESEFSLQPATVRHLNPGEEIQLANPPGVDGYGDFNRETLRSIAAGFGISYEALTGDYSQSNYSSSRMGHIEFRRNIDTWRWNIIIPQFCDPYFQHFLRWAKAVKGVDITDARAEWVPPANSMIDPSKEIGADKEAVKAGFKSRSQVIREQGGDPELVLEEIKQEREAATSAGVSFDTDISNQSADTQGVNNEENNEETADQSDTSVG